MDTPVAVIPAPAPSAREGSSMRRFLAERGVIMMKESRVVASIPLACGGAPLEVAGHVLVIVKGSERHVSVGVKFEQAETSTTIGSAAFVDADELDEFLGAFDFITMSASQMIQDRRDYTEVMYSTRDDLMIGFYQDGQKQQAFARLGVGSRSIFFGVETLKSIQAATVRAREHVDARRVAWEAR